MLFFHWLNISPLVVSQWGKLERGREEESGREWGQGRGERDGEPRFQTSWTPALERQWPSLKFFLPHDLDPLFVPCMSVIRPGPFPRMLPPFLRQELIQHGNYHEGFLAFLCQFNCLIWRKERIRELLECIKEEKEILGEKMKPKMGGKQERRRKLERKTGKRRKG